MPQVHSESFGGERVYNWRDFRDWTAAVQLASLTQCLRAPVVNFYSMFSLLPPPPSSTISERVNKRFAPFFFSFLKKEFQMRELMKKKRSTRYWPIISALAATKIAPSFSPGVVAYFVLACHKQKKRKLVTWQFFFCSFCFIPYVCQCHLPALRNVLTFIFYGATLNCKSCCWLMPSGQKWGSRDLNFFFYHRAWLSGNSRAVGICCHLTAEAMPSTFELLNAWAYWALSSRWIHLKFTLIHLGSVRAFFCSPENHFLFASAIYRFIAWNGVIPVLFLVCFAWHAVVKCFHWKWLSLMKGSACIIE